MMQPKDRIERRSRDSAHVAGPILEIVVVFFKTISLRATTGVMACVVNAYAKLVTV